MVSADDDHIRPFLTNVYNDDGANGRGRLEDRKWCWLEERVKAVYGSDTVDSGFPLT
jgi:hypothetical protein